MFFIYDKKHFFETYAILKGEKQLSLPFKEMKEYIEREFSIHVLNISLIRINTNIFNKAKKYSLLYGKKYHFIIDVLNYSERDFMKKKICVNDKFPAYNEINDEKKENKIYKYLFKLNEKYHMFSDCVRDDIHLDFLYFFETNYLNYIINKSSRKIKSEIMALYKKSANIWYINFDGAVDIFYKKYEDMKRNLNDGTNQKIIDIINKHIKEVDDLNKFNASLIRFDSKQNIDENYEGSLDLYYR